MLRKLLLVVFSLLVSLGVLHSPAFAYDSTQAYTYLQNANAAIMRVMVTGDYPFLVMADGYDTYAIDFYSVMATHYVDCIGAQCGPCYDGWWRDDAYDELEDAADNLVECMEEIVYYGQDWEEGDPEYPDTIDGCKEIKDEMIRCYNEAWEEYYESDWDACVRFCQDCMAWEDGDHEVIEWEWDYYELKAPTPWDYWFEQADQALHNARTYLLNCDEEEHSFVEEDDPGPVPTWPESFQ